MRLSTISNTAYAITLSLTLASGVSMVIATNSLQEERKAVQLRYDLDKSTNALEHDIFALTMHARQYLNTGTDTYKIIYKSDYKNLLTVEKRIEKHAKLGLNAKERAIIDSVYREADTMHDEQLEAIKLFDAGQEQRAREILFGPVYEQQLKKIDVELKRFQDLLDNRVNNQIMLAAASAKNWKFISEVSLGVTGLLFLFVLYFVFRQRVLKPVIKLSDVVTRLAANDYEVEPEKYNQIDEIGNMAEAIRIFRENGLERQRLELQRTADLEMRDLISCMTQRMQGCDSIHDLKKVIQRFMPQIFPSYAGRLYLLETKRNVLVSACDWKKPIHSAREFPPSACWALRRNLPHRPDGDTGIDVPCMHTSDEGVTDKYNTLCMPLTSQRESLGLLYLEIPGEEHCAAENYADMLAENIALAISNLRLREKLELMAMVDPLTGLSNRRRLERYMEQEVVEVVAQNRPVSCLMLDIDHFKHFNDEFGHDAGDLVLQEVGKVLRESCRDSDHAFRYGGEEFTILMSDIDCDNAVERAEQIRTQISELNLSCEGRKLGNITASVGAASTPQHCPLDKLIQTADAVLLRAKVAGRDRVLKAAVRDRDDDKPRKLPKSA